MSSPVVTVGPDALMAEILQIMLERRIGGVLVVDAHRVVGSVGEGELLHRHEIGTEDSMQRKGWWQRVVRRDLGDAYVRSHGLHARDLMSRDLVSIGEDTVATRIAAIFTARHIRRVPVLRGADLVGIVTRADLVRALAEKACGPAATACADNDEKIRLRLLDELQRHPWWQPRLSTVFVSSGVVHYVGLYELESDRDAARVAAENVPGVLGINDNRVAVDIEPLV